MMRTSHSSTVVAVTTSTRQQPYAWLNKLARQQDKKERKDDATRFWYRLLLIISKCLRE